MMTFSTEWKDCWVYHVKDGNTDSSLTECMFAERGHAFLVSFMVKFLVSTFTFQREEE